MCLCCTARRLFKLRQVRTAALALFVSALHRRSASSPPSRYCIMA